MMNQDDLIPLEEARHTIGVLNKSITAETNPEHLAKLYLERAHWHNVLEDMERSIADYLHAISIGNDNSDRSHCKAMIALAFTRRKEMEKAALWSLDAVNQDPTNSEAHYVLGLVCDAAGFLNCAITSIRAALSLNPSDWDAVLKLGECLRRVGNYQESLEQLSVYVAHKCHDPVGLYELGLSTHESKQTSENREQALQYYEMALNENPEPYLKQMIAKQQRRLGLDREFPTR